MLLKRVKYTFLFTIICLCITQHTWAQSINTNFGKNRIQYHDDFNNWKNYETENFLVYWYGKGTKVANMVIQMAELDHDNIQQLLEHRINDKIEVVVYIDLSDLKQSNIGYEEAFSNQTGKTKVLGNKMFVYFNGDHKQLRRQIREGIASVYLNSLLEGSNLQQIVQNSIQLELAQWFRDGLISYVGSRWDYELDDELRDIIFQDKKYREFKNLEKDHPKIAGHSLWYFLDLQYGKSSIANILYLTRIRRDLESSFLYVLNKEFSDVTYEWESWLSKHYDSEFDKFDDLFQLQEIQVPKKDFVPVSQLKFSPDGSKLLMTQNRIGKTKLEIYDLETKETTTIFKTGSKNAFQATDFVYPLASWHDNSQEISFVYERKDFLYIRKYDLSTGQFIEQLLPENIQRIYSMDIWDETRYILSGSLDGLSDILVYDTKGRTVRKITDDFFDDLESEVVRNNQMQGVYFTSNRTDESLIYRPHDTILPLENFDVFYMDLSDFDNPRIQRLTDTPKTNERQIEHTGGKSYTYLSERNGMLNMYFSKENQTGQPLSNWDRNIILKSSSRDLYAFQAYHDGQYKIYIEKIPEQSVKQKLTTYYKDETSDVSKLLFPVLQAEEEKDKFPESWKFQSDFEDPENLEAFTKTKEEEELTPNSTNQLPDHKLGVEKIVPERAGPSRITFKIEDISTTFDNSVLFEGLENYVEGENQLDFATNGLLLKARVKDLFEDYILEGGVRIPTRFNGTEYYVTADNNKKLIDKRLSFYRRSITEPTMDNMLGGNQRTRNRTFLTQYRLKYPFSVYSSLRATIGLRDDREFELSSDLPSFNSELVNEKRLNLRLEYVYDNTVDVGTNIKNGTRLKVYSELINGFELQLFDGFSVDASTGLTGVIGYDVRHYIGIGRHAAFALRAAGATSFGNNKILYFLGGSEGDIFRRTDEITTVPNDNFAFRTAASHVRGFNSNVRNGASYALTNTELRLPVMKMLGFEKLKLALLRELQLVGFFDAGLAWHGNSPFSSDNPINTLTIENPPVITVTVQFFRDPLVYSYGLGLRTSLFGYYLRLDYGWGVETQVVQPGKLHVSLGFDF